MSLKPSLVLISTIDLLTSFWLPGGGIGNENLYRAAKLLEKRSSLASTSCNTQPSLPCYAENNNNVRGLNLGVGHLMKPERPPGLKSLTHSNLSWCLLAARTLPLNLDRPMGLMSLINLNARWCLLASWRLTCCPAAICSRTALNLLELNPNSHNPTTQKSYNSYNSYKYTCNL